MPSKPKIVHTRLFKACGFIEQFRTKQNKINNVINILGINYEEPKEVDSQGDSPQFKLAFKCSIRNTKDSNPETDGEIKATVEIGLTITLDSYSPNYLNDVMQAAWPYLRTAAQLQLQILGLPQNADKLPYQIAPKELPQKD